MNDTAAVARETATPGLAAALARAAAALARLDQAAGSHPLLPALLHRARLHAVRRQAAADGLSIEPWQLAAVIEGLPLRLSGPRIIDGGSVLEAARAALDLYGWLTLPDFDQEGDVQRAERAIAGIAAPTPLLAGAHAMHRWLQGGQGRPAIRAALVRHWTRSGLLRSPLPLTGCRALAADTPWREDLWVVAFLDAVACEAAVTLDLLIAMEHAWRAARAAVPPRRSTSRAPAVLDLMAATPLISATTLAGAIGMSVKSALQLLERFVQAGVVVEVTHRAARRLFGLRAVGEEVRAVVRPPYRPEPGRGRGRPPSLPVVEEKLEPSVPVAPLSHSFPPIDYSGLEAAMAHADQVIRSARSTLRGLAAGHKGEADQHARSRSD